MARTMQTAAGAKESRRAFRKRRSSRGALSTPKNKELIAKFQAALPPPCYTTTGKSSHELVEDILRTSGCAPGMLSTMHISAAEIISPILQYAALYQRHVSGIDHAVLTAPSTRAIRIHPEEIYECHAAKKQRPSLDLHVQMGDTIGVVEWPPPLNLTSIGLSEYIYENSSEAFLDLNKHKFGSGSSSSDNGRPLDVKTDVIYIAPYKAGGKIINEVNNERPKEDALLLATVGPNDALVNFASDIMEWSKKRSKIADPGDTQFGLYRLKSSMWIRERNRQSREIHSVFLPKHIHEELVEDAHTFFSDEAQDWYLDFGVPYRRAYMFHGPPGTGKTSMIKALASDLACNICFLSMTQGLNLQHVADAMANLPKNAMIVIEDVDALFDTAGQMKISFSALLNILDGIVSEEGVLTIMTTNHVTRIDPIAMRAGRVDRLFFFGPATDDVLRQCFRYFYDDASDATVEKFVALLPKQHEAEVRSIATLQEHFIGMREETAEECVEKLPEFIKNYANRASLLKGK